jgi:cell fate regulator YaaT (PSP1 superfamily)
MSGPEQRDEPGSGADPAVERRSPCCGDGCAVVARISDWVRVVVDPELPPVACRLDEAEPAHGECWVVETSDGTFLGQVTTFAPPIVKVPRTSGGRLVRVATEQDRARGRDLRRLERDIEAYLRRRTRELGIDLRPLKVRLPLSGRKAMIYFTAEKRVDYRSLLRELGRRFRRRIEMRPLGVRDGARLSGGLGPCGRSLCCTTFMDRFHSVTVRMAKRQNLSLNPTKISGLCSRLMCCLAHEVDQYPAPAKSKGAKAKQ